MRLIDADELKEKWQSDLEECLENGVDYIDSDIEDVFYDFIRDLDTAPTLWTTADIDSVTAEHERIGYEKGFRDGQAQAVTEVICPTCGAKTTIIYAGGE